MDGTKTCAICRDVFSRRKTEDLQRYATRPTCSLKCGHQYAKETIRIRRKQKAVARAASPAGFDAEDEVRFWSMVEKGDGCWLWMGPRKGTGYGAFNWYTERKRSRHAHRVSYTLTYGHIPDGLLVCHHCDTPLCVRPNHLFLGTHADNTADMVRKGRRRGPIERGEANSNAKLTWAKVREMRARYAAGGITMAALGDAFNVDRATVGYIIRGDTWRDDPEAAD